MIPKKIHYCWFGRGKKPKLAKKCIASWKRFCPDYEIIEWNEDNFDIGMNAYTQKCYDNKKFAFLSDYVRLFVVEKCGGIYLDTDVELLKPLDDLLSNKAYVGFENNEYVATGLGFGSEAHGEMVKAMILEYQPLLDGNSELIPCPILNTQAMIKLGMRLGNDSQEFSGISVFPSDYLNPLDSTTGVLKKTENTISIHWYCGSWLKKRYKIMSFFTRYLHRIFGTEVFIKIRKRANKR